VPKRSGDVVRRYVAASLLILVAGPVGLTGSDGAGVLMAAAPAASAPPPDPPAASPPAESPPRMTVQASGRSVDLGFIGGCYRNICADGDIPADLFDVGATDEIRVTFPWPGWTVIATFQKAGDVCSRQQAVPLRRDADGSMRLRSVGLPGTYEVLLQAWGPPNTRGDAGGGDALFAVRWRTTTRGELPRPEAVADGSALRIANLRRTPDTATAVMTVRAGDGSTRTTALERSRPGSCVQEGSVEWRTPGDPQGSYAWDSPVGYEVEVVLDGTRHRGTGNVADRTDHGVQLTFTPPLPALG
jgi:hypothetical protein